MEPPPVWLLSFSKQPASEQVLPPLFLDPCPRPGIPTPFFYLISKKETMSQAGMSIDPRV
ncbi:hypothetical protein BD289DRAFT_431596 [Coniella lustricola]|uniref:Uncharacterized protein n=1 Tax=Coniella lustricola TaxID=2025994 RepID=A0A2T3AAM3_9PEZI|nr:hypothetical protein BD289DRAFT_431596 [Coniella lustricola]